LSGSLEQISWRWGRFGSSTPSMRAISGLQAPAAFTTLCVRIVPRFVTTASMRRPFVSKPTTSV
jgi:hypothetical protein